MGPKWEIKLTIPYTYESYRKIFSKKVKGKSHPLYSDRKLRSYQEHINTIRKNHPKPRNPEKQNQIDKLIIKKRDRINEILLHSASQAEIFSNAKELPWKLKYHRSIKGRKIYTSNRETAWAFAVHQAQEDINDRLPSAQKSRDYNVFNLISTINTQADIKIIKIDIQKYYDSIPHKKLKETLNSIDIPILSRRIANQLIESYSKLEGTKKGIPQGITLSNTIADAFLLGFDKKIKTKKSILYYSRYVDDIVLVLDESSMSANDMLKLIKTELNSLGLSLNEKKMHIVENKKIRDRIDEVYKKQTPEVCDHQNISGHEVNCLDRRDYLYTKREVREKIKETNYKFIESFSFNYLGYQITPKIKKVQKQRIIRWYPDLPREKIESIKNKIDLSFEDWDKSVQKMLRLYPNNGSSSTVKQQRSFRARIDYILIRRISLISSNYRLDFKNSHIVTGFYYSNKQSNQSDIEDTLKELDTYLEGRYNNIKHSFTSNNSKNRIKLSKINFSNNFANQNFIQLPPKEYKEITGIWR